MSEVLIRNDNRCFFDLTPIMPSPSLDFIDYPESEVVIGIVAPTGTNTDYIETELKQRLQNYGYSPIPVRLSSLLKLLDHGVDIKDIPPFERIWSLMDAGDAVRTKTGRGDALALLAVSEILKERPKDSIEKPEPKPKAAYILRSLKHPDEVIALRRVYKEGFYLFGIFDSEANRIKYLVEDKIIDAKDATKLVERDQNEETPNDLGQKTRDTFHLADAFVSLSVSKDDAKKQLWRILDLLFGHPFETPTPDEHAMYLAYATSFRSADLSRQVGAVVLSESNELLAVGTNEVPRFGGGIYDSLDKNDSRDHKKGLDSNAERKNKIVDGIVTLVTEDFSLKDNEEVKKKLEVFGSVEALVKAGVSKTLLSYITEFGRPVHAEMEALLSCARKSLSPQNGTLYTTTFPCHNCAKHIINAGIKRVVYVEPYPKSLAGELHDDAISLEGGPAKKVKFEPFVGIGSRRFMDLFSMGLSSGHPIKRKKSNSHEKVGWKIDDTKLRVPMLPTSYLEREEAAALEIKKKLEERNEEKN
jgi:deoxycytidylate deaminase